MKWYLIDFTVFYSWAYIGIEVLNKPPYSCTFKAIRLKTALNSELKKTNRKAMYEFKWFGNHNETLHTCSSGKGLYYREWETSWWNSLCTSSLTQFRRDESTVCSETMEWHGYIPTRHFIRQSLSSSFFVDKHCRKFPLWRNHWNFLEHLELEPPSLPSPLPPPPLLLPELPSSLFVCVYLRVFGPWTCQLRHMAKLSIPQIYLYIEMCEPNNMYVGFDVATHFFQNT